MENDASTAGVLHGGLFNQAEIKILICYILDAIGEPIPANMLVNTLHYEGIANAFEVSDALYKLERDGFIVQKDKNDDTYTVTAEGKDIADTLATTLSMVVKERSYKATIKMFTHFKNAKHTKCEYVEENGKKYIQCSALDNDGPFMSIRLLVTDNAQGQYIKEKFIDDPAKVYSAIIELLTK